MDSTDADYDFSESMVTCNCQVSTKGNWEQGEMVAFMDKFLKDNLLELRYSLVCAKYANFLEHGIFHDPNATSSSAHNSTGTSLSAAFSASNDAYDTKKSTR